MKVASPEPIWIDTDIYFNRVGEDVDDGLALMMALQHRGVKIVGISLNEDVDNGYDVTQKLIGYYGRYDIPLYKGEVDNGERVAFNSPKSNGAAVQKMAEELTKEPMTIMALGNAINIASLIEFHPDAAKNIKEVIFCAGRQAGVTFLAKDSDDPLPDANFDNAPEAMIRVLQSDVPVTLVGFEASSNIYLDWDDINEIRKNGRNGDGWVFWRLLIWLALWKVVIGVDGFIPFDTATMAHTLFPGQLRYHRQIPIKVNERANDARRWKDTERKQYLEVSYDYDSPMKVDFAYEIKPSFKKHLMRNLLGKLL